MARRTKQTQNMIDSFNSYLRENKVKQYEDVVIAFNQALLDAGVYEGFNYFNREWFLVDGEHYYVDKLAESSKDYEYILFY